MVSHKSSIYKLKGVIKKYDWGGTEFLSRLLSFSNPGKETLAEYWLGAHDLSSSVLITGKGEIKLNDFISGEAETILGKTVTRKFGRLPYLLKVLDVNDMLSIQVHPAKHEAEIEFARENAEGIPLSAARRNYKDDNHKQELMVALSDFWLLHGFKPVEKLNSILQTIPEFKPLLDIFNATGYDQLYKTVMEMPQQSVNDLLKPLLDRIILLYQKNLLTKDQEDFWAARAALIFNRQPVKIDRGIFSIYFFNLLQLKKGEGIFQDAGVPHAYLKGQNIEIMANSDNVLRGGLTNKYIDVKELMKHVRFEEIFPAIIRPKKINANEEIYRTASPDFRLSRFELKEGEVSSFETVSGEIVLVMEGTISLTSENEELNLSKGEAAFITSHQAVSVKALASADFYKASVPVHTDE